MGNEKMCIFIKKYHAETEDDGTDREFIFLTVNVSAFFKRIIDQFKAGENYTEENLPWNDCNNEPFKRCKVKRIILHNISGAGRVLFTKYDVKFTIRMRNLTEAERFIGGLKHDVARILKAYESVGASTKISAVVVENGGDEHDD